MTSIKKITGRYGRLCRMCMNELYHTDLQRTDCIYDGPYQALCSHCGKMKNIVTDFTLTGKLKMVMKK